MLGCYDAHNTQVTAFLSISLNSSSHSSHGMSYYSCNHLILIFILYSYYTRLRLHAFIFNIHKIVSNLQQVHTLRRTFALQSKQRSGSEISAGSTSVSRFSPQPQGIRDADLETSGNVQPVMAQFSTKPSHQAGRLGWSQ